MQFKRLLRYVVFFIAVATLKVVASQFLNSKNEPHDVTWDTCLNGGEINDRPNKRRQSPKAFEADPFTLFLEDLPPLYR